MPEEIKKSKSKLILAHLGESWRCWKANVVWKVPGMPIEIENLIKKYVELKANWWTTNTIQTRKRIREGITMDKTACKKNMGRLSRLYFKREIAR